MLGTPPPGFYTNSSNRQTVQGLNAPGLQSNPVTPGANKLSYSAFQGPNQQGVTAPMPGASSFTQLSSNPAPPLMNQYMGSSNRSTLLRTLLGKTH